VRIAYSREREARRLSEAPTEKLLAEVRDGSEAAFEILVERSTDDLLRWVYRYLGHLEEARDVVQQTFLRVWTRRKRYDPARGARTWMFRIATNLAIDRLRQQRRQRRRDDEVRRLRLASESIGAGGLPEHWSRREVAEIFQQLSTGLSPRQRAAFLLREAEGLTSKEAAAILGCRPSTVRNQVAQAREVLRRELNRRFPEYVPPARREPDDGNDT
jgi:RNA polymerase sigma-70 factor (ECF subfamily)